MCSRNCITSCSCSGNKNKLNKSNNIIKVFSGSDLRLNFKFPFSISDKVFSVVSSSNSALDNPVIEMTDEFNFLLTWAGSDIAKLPISLKQRFRVGLTFVDGSQKNYNNLWIISE